MAAFLTILFMGLVTYAIRLGPILLLERISLPPLALRALRYVPPAVLAAIIFPELLQPTGMPAGRFVYLSAANLRRWAGLLAALVAWRTRNVLLTIALGMATLWLLQALTG